MKPALPTASVAYGLSGPSATAIVDNATPAGLHLSSGKNCPNKRDRLCTPRALFHFVFAVVVVAGQVSDIGYVLRALYFKSFGP